MKITNREKELLIHIVNGLTNEEIAEKMFITKHTVKAHIATLFRKMNSKSRINLAVKSIHYGLIDADSIEIEVNNDLIIN